VPSPQSNNHSSALWGNLRATLETLRDRVGTPELVPKNVICTAFFSLPLAQVAALCFYSGTVDEQNTFSIEHWAWGMGHWERGKGKRVRGKG